MSTDKNTTSCDDAAHICEAIAALRAKAVRHPEHEGSYFLAAHELIRVERRHFEHCHTCQAIEAQEAR